VVADLGSTAVAAFTADMNGIPVAVVNRLAEHDPVVREQAELALAAAGFSSETIHEVLDGIRS
jgi:hypothetical protein